MEGEYLALSFWAVARGGSLGTEVLGEMLMLELGS